MTLFLQGLHLVESFYSNSPPARLHGKVSKTWYFFSFVCSSIHSFVSYFFSSFVWPFVLSFLRPFVPSSLRPFVPSSLRLFFSSFLRSFALPFLRLFVPSCLFLSIRLLARSFHIVTLFLPSLSFLCFVFFERSLLCSSFFALFAQKTVDVRCTCILSFVSCGDQKLLRATGDSDQM